MNERIRLLAEQANVLHAEFFDNELEVEQFAQLIVEECTKIADTAEPFLSSDLIKKHFGVE